jgi:hypothetical protein
MAWHVSTHSLITVLRNLGQPTGCLPTSPVRCMNWDTAKSTTWDKLVFNEMNFFSKITTTTTINY